MPDDTEAGRMSHTDAARIIETDHGRRFIAALLEECMFEMDAFGTNAALMASNVAKQNIANTIKDWVYKGGGKAAWRKMEDEIDIVSEAAEEEYEKSLAKEITH